MKNLEKVGLPQKDEFFFALRKNGRRSTVILDEQGFRDFMTFVSHLKIPPYVLEDETRRDYFTDLCNQYEAVLALKPKTSLAARMAEDTDSDG